MNDFVWTVRVRAVDEPNGPCASVHARNLAFRIGDPLSFRPSDALPSALETVLGALAADLIGTFRTAARRRRVPLDNVEMALNGALHDPLAHVGVVGEEGDPSLKGVSGAIYVSSDADPAQLQQLWAEAQSRSPLYRTLIRAADVNIRFETTV